MTTEVRDFFNGDKRALARAISRLRIERLTVWIVLPTFFRTAAGQGPRNHGQSGGRKECAG